ncbi:MAG: hypothetical protein Q7U04_07425 [Bacteriovorax sp.]|nr:hypothetical protein [Bacteriovorax sp.]
MIKKFTKKIKQAFFNQLPVSVKGDLIRSSIKIPVALSENMCFKIANTSIELEEAYTVLHDAYVEQTFITPQKNGMRIISHYVLPTTTTIIGKIDEEVIGTLSIIKAGELGVPMDKVFDISTFIEKNQTYAEISSLAIKKEFRREYGSEIFFPLLKYMYEYCTEFFHVENLLIVIHPKDEAFYNGLMFFEKIPNTGVIDYMGNPAIALVLNLKYALNRFEEFYKGKSQEKDMYSYFVKTRFPQFVFPKREYQTTNDSIINEKIFRDFFIEKGNLFENISLKDFMHLKDYFSNTSLGALFTDYLNIQRVIRSYHRYSVKMKGVVKDLDHNFIVTDLSQKGIKAKSVTPFERGIVYDLGIFINDQSVIYVKASLVRSNQNIYAFQLTHENLEWKAFIDALENLHFTKKAS